MKYNELTQDEIELLGFDNDAIKPEDDLFIGCYQIQSRMFSKGFLVYHQVWVVDRPVAHRRTCFNAVYFSEAMYIMEQLTYKPCYEETSDLVGLLLGLLGKGETSKE